MKQDQLFGKWQTLMLFCSQSDILSLTELDLLGNAARLSIYVCVCVCVWCVCGVCVWGVCVCVGCVCVWGVCVCVRTGGLI